MALRQSGPVSRLCRSFLVVAACLEFHRTALFAAKGVRLCRHRSPRAASLAMVSATPGGNGQLLNDAQGGAVKAARGRSAYLSWPLRMSCHCALLSRLARGVDRALGHLDRLGGRRGLKGGSGGPGSVVIEEGVEAAALIMTGSRPRAVPPQTSGETAGEAAPQASTPGSPALISARG